MSARRRSGKRHHSPQLASEGALHRFVPFLVNKASTAEVSIVVTIGDERRECRLVGKWRVSARDRSCVRRRVDELLGYYAEAETQRWEHCLAERADVDDPRNCARRTFLI